MKNCLLIALAFILAISHNWAQPPVGQPIEKLETMADENLGKNDTWNALELYMKVYNKKPNDSKATYDVAYTYFMLRDYPDAEVWFKKVLDVDSERIFKLAKWYYAYSMKLNAKYDECIPVFEEFKLEYDGADADRYKTLASVEIEGAKWAKKQDQPLEELKITNAGKEINSALMESFAFPIGRDKMIFSSLRSDTIIFVEKAEVDEKFVKIFISEFDNNAEEWKKATEFNPTVLKKEGFHSVNPTFNPSMTKFYFVRARLVGNLLENSKIYYCSYDGNSVGEPILLDFNNDSYSCKNPSVGIIDGKEVLFFSSNMPGGKGGFDIWYAEINTDGTTRQPLNLEAVNSAGDDSYPFYDARDNNMYFASTGHPGFGGIDMFTSKRDKSGSWGKVTNMGPGFNTSLDEFGFIINQQGKDDCYGHFISNREGTTTVPGKKTSTDDIFTVLMPERCDVELTIKVYDQENGNKPVNGATVQLIDKASGEVVDEQSNTNGNNYTFLLEQGKEYDVVAKKEGWESGAETYVDARRPALEQRFGKDTDKPMAWEDKTTLREIGLIVETYNKKTNELLGGATVIIYGSDNSVLVESTLDASRHELKVPRSGDIRIQARLQGFVGESKNVSKAEMKNIQKLYLTPPPIFVNVLFDYDKFNIRQGAADTLDMIANILEEHPDMVVEVRGHTDSRGPNNYNQTLSQNRANSAMQYLTDKGIDKNRMIPKGFGEDEPVAPNEDENGNDDPAGRQLNRRVEFKIIKGEGAVGSVETQTENTVAEIEKKNR